MPSPAYRARARPHGLCRDAPGYVARVTVDHDGKTPVYLQIAVILRDRITSGQILPGRPVPSEPQLVAEFGVAKLTARKAVRVLADEGLVEVVQGRGAYVRE
jgi:GntR family transcriptional regulator